MIDERALIARIDAANPEEFSRMLQNLSSEEEHALRIHFGDDNLREMLELALRKGVRRAPPADDRNVVVLHGIIGGVVLALCLAAFARKRWNVLLMAFLVFHLHLLCDLVGSRGTGRSAPTAAAASLRASTKLSCGCAAFASNFSA